jgi:hypothetical protein
MTKNIWLTIAKIALFVLMVAAIVTMAVCLKKQGDDKRRLKENYDIELSKDHSRQQTVDVRELKEYFDREVETIKEHGIRARDVENIVEVSYHYRDTTIYRDTLIYLYDTVTSTRSADFRLETACYNIDGRIVGDTLEIQEVTALDEILVSLYKERRKCLFGKRRVKAIAVSGCTGDTLAILRNLKIGK